MTGRRERAAWAVLIVLLVVMGGILALQQRRPAETVTMLTTVTRTTTWTETRTTTETLIHTTTLTETITTTTTVTRTLRETLIPSTARPPLVLAYTYLWYGVDFPDRHWNDSPVTLVVDRPLLGYYNSSDPRILEVQLRQLEAAGFDGVIVSWWGQGSPSDRALRVLVELLETRVAGLRFAVMVEPSRGEDPDAYTEEWWRTVLDYLEKNYIEPHRDKYLHLHGKPLILAYSPIGRSYDPRQAFNEYTIRLVDGGDWYLWPRNDTGLAGTLTIARDGYVALTPRIDTSHMVRAGAEKENITLDPDLSKRWYINQWFWVLGRRGNISIVAIYSWNEYHERSQIEPHIDGKTGEENRLLYDLTRVFIAMLKQDPLLLAGATGPSRALMEEFLASMTTCTGLLRATPHTGYPDHSRAYTASDGIVALPVLSVSSPELAVALVEALWRYGYYNNGIHTSLVGGSSANYTLNTSDILLAEAPECGVDIYATVARNETLAWRGFADRIVYAIINRTLKGSLEEAEKLFEETLLGLWDGYGFNDSAAKNRSRYDTYKVALAIYAYRMLGALNPEFAAKYRGLAEIWVEILARAQDPHGGLLTDYWVEKGELVFGGACNVETTAMAYLALYTNYPLLLAWSSLSPGG